MGEHTKRQYQSAYNVVQRIMGEDMDYIKRHPEEVIKKLKSHEYKEGKKYDEKSLKNLITAILSSYRDEKGIIECELQEFHLQYLNIFRKLKEGVVDYYKSNKHNEKKRDGFVPWDEILKKREQLAKNEYGSRRHLLLSMYTYIPPLRQDFNEVKVYARKPREDKGNYLIINTRTKKLVLNEDKTQYCYGRYEKDLPKELAKIIKSSLEQEPRDFLFVTLDNGKPYNSNSFTKFSNNTLKELFDNPHVSVSLLRSAHITSQDFNKLSEGDKEELAKDMRHSVRQQGEYRHVEN